MIITQLTPTRYIKQPSETEQYLMTLIETEIKKVDKTDRATISYLTQEILARVKSEITNMNGSAGVVSVNGKNGVVTITPANIQAEPAFRKQTAFNKNFGTTANTVVEGNDPRLSDARRPIAHQHSAADINGLDNVISWNTKVMELDDKAHTHANQSLLNKLNYPGNKETINLGLLDQLEKYTTVNIEAIQSHVDDGSRNHISAQERSSWNSKETTSGAQLKANLALDSAKSYTDASITHLIDGASTTYQTLSKIESVIANNALAPIQQIQDIINNTLTPHKNNSEIHLNTTDRATLNAVANKSDRNHTHKEYLSFMAFENIQDMN